MLNFFDPPRLDHNAVHLQTCSVLPAGSGYTCQAMAASTCVSKDRGPCRAMARGSRPEDPESTCREPPLGQGPGRELLWAIPRSWKYCCQLSGPKVHQAKGDYSGALRFNVCPLGVRFMWDPFTPSFFPISPFWKGTVYSMPVPLL